MTGWRMSGQTGDEKDLRSAVTSLGEQMAALLFAAGLTLGFVFIISINLVLDRQFELAVGDVVPETVTAPESITYESAVLTEERRQQVASNIYRYTPLDRNVGRQQTAKARDIFGFVDVVRADALAGMESKMRYLEAIQGLALEGEVVESLLMLPQQQYATARSESLNVIAEAMQEEVREDDVGMAQELARQRIGFDLSLAQEQVVSAVVTQLIVPNVFFDEEATGEARADAAMAVAPIMNDIRADDLIVRQGDEVEAIHLEELAQLGLLRASMDWFAIFGALIFSLMLTLIFILYWRRFQRSAVSMYRYLVILGVLMLLFGAVARVMLINRNDWIYLFPAVALGMLLTVITETRTAVLVSVLMAAFVGYIGDNSLGLAMYSAVGSILACLMLQDTQRFYAFFRAGMFGAVGNMAVIALLYVDANVEFSQTLWLLTYAFINAALISPIITIAGFFFVGLFGVTTVVQLQDLSRLDHPLLKELLRKAPGTYHHSIMVANLAEQAAERVGANSTLVRVGSFYHDIGKMNRPAFFTENQQGGINPHESLDPYSSARIIAAHVTDGLTMARASRLPNRIQDFIEEHHGDRLMKVFYEKAKEAAGEDAEMVDPERFRHQGRRPTSREAGIVLLADTIDAASSAIRPSTAEEIEKLVNSLVDDHLKEGQLDNANLTMGDIKMIRASFIETLNGRFHVRVRYPGNDEMMGVAPPTGGALSPPAHAPVRQGRPAGESVSG